MSGHETVTIAKIDGVLRRLEAYTDSLEVAREVGDLGSYLCEDGYWAKEAQTHILGLWKEARSMRHLLRQWRRELKSWEVAP